MFRQGKEGEMILTQPRQMPQNLIEWHIVPLPQCCPISGNPQKGSYLMLCYQPKEVFLEVYSLKAYIDKFVGGYENIRDMEGMIQAICQECANTLGVFVSAGAWIVLQRGDFMSLVVGAQSCAG